MTDTKATNVVTLFSLGGIALLSTVALIIVKSTIAPTLSFWLVFLPLIIVYGPVVVVFVLVGFFALIALFILPALDRHARRKQIRTHNKLKYTPLTKQEKK